MLKIVHAADFHLDSAFAGLPAEQSRERRQENRELLDRLTDLVLLEKADLVLLSGDLFDGERVYPETLERLMAALERMKCPVFIAPGNCDPYTRNSPYARQIWPENVCIFREKGMSALTLPELGCVVHGAAFTERTRTDHVLAGRVVPEDRMTHIFCLHGDAANPTSEYGPITKEQLGQCKANYAALGHVHQCSGLQKEKNTYWAYPGCLEGRGFDEPGDKGVLVGTVGPSAVSMRFVPLCRRRYWVLEADVTDVSPREALERVMPDTAGEDICRAVFTGETGELGIDLEMMGSMFRDRFYALELRDKTKPSQSLWERAEENSLRGVFLQEMKKKYDAASDEAAREQVVLALRFGLAALDGRE